MPSTSETGHYRNIANFHQLTQYCSGFGAQYNPANIQIAVPGLTSLHSNANTLHQAVATARQPYVNAVNERQLRFKELPGFATRIVNALVASTGVSDLLISDARTILRKIRGSRAVSVNPDSETSISVSQRSYDMLLDHFVELVALVSAVATYTPNETELQIPNLNNAKTQATALNQSVVTASVALANARLQRNKALYADPIGLIFVAKDVKAYVKSVFGGASPEFKLVNAIRFRLVK